MPWIRRMFKGCKVYTLCDDNGQPVVQNGLAQIKYRLEDSRIYNARRAALQPLADAANAAPQSATPPAAPSSDRQPPVAAEAQITIYVDGACTGNPGPAGVGIVLLYQNHRKEISQAIGEGTNNIAELTAIKLALEAVKDRSLDICLNTDSSYCLGVLTKNWKARENLALINEIRALMRTFPRLRFFKVKGHAGVPENERADQLARAAITGAKNV